MDETQMEQNKQSVLAEFRFLSSDEVIRFRGQGISYEDQNSAILVNSCRNGNDITYVEQIKREISSQSQTVNYLVQGCAVEVVLLDRTGWHRGKVKLELIFYPEEPQTQPVATCNEALDLLSS
ncbi:hypothetical protein [Thermosynechococcus sp. FA-CM-4201]